MIFSKKCRNSIPSLICKGIFVYILIMILAKFSRKINLRKNEQISAQRDELQLDDKIKVRSLEKSNITVHKFGNERIIQNDGDNKLRNGKKKIIAHNFLKNREKSRNKIIQDVIVVEGKTAKRQKNIKIHQKIKFSPKNPNIKEYLHKNDADTTYASNIPSDLRPILSKLLRKSFEKEFTIPCKNGFYRMEGMNECKPWIGCNEINDQNIVKKGEKLGGGIGKLVYSGTLNGQHDIAIVENRQRQRLSERVLEGNHNLMMLQPSPYVIQVVGYCEHLPNSTILTESCPTCMDFGKLKKRGKFNKYSDKQRFEWAVKVVGGFDYLHHGAGLPRVHCDLHTAEESLTQFLINKDSKLIMADLDEIPQVDEGNGKYATCKEETGGVMKTPDFIAPEQRYTLDEYKKKKSKKPITEKADIWKIPDLTKILLEGAKTANILSIKLENIHKKCKNLDPKLRPTAREVLIEYLKVLNKLAN